MTSTTSGSHVLDLGPVPGGPGLVLAEGPAGAWARANRDAVRAAVRERGALLVRGLDLPGAEALGDFAAPLVDEIAGEQEGFARRRTLHGPVRSSLDWPPDQPMCMHHELSYLQRPPGLLVIGCLTPPATGGVTGLSDAREILTALPADLTDRFRREGWQLVRTYTGVVGLTWQESFGTADPAQVQAYADAQGINCEWLPGGGLRTVQQRPAVVRHPVTGEECWFNQIAFLNDWTMDPMVREYLVMQLGEDGLPYTTRHGNGDPIDEPTVALINATYETRTLREPWQQGDVIVIDNIRTAHSREPYTGNREMALVIGNPTALDAAGVRA